MKRFSLALMSLLFLVTTSCEKKELCYKVHPHDSEIVNTTFTFTIDPEFSNPDKTLSLDGVMAATGEYKMRYTLEFWSIDGDGNPETLYKREQFVGSTYTESDMTYTCSDILLPALELKMLIWADPIIESDSEHFFDVESLLAVEQSDCGNKLGHDGFTNTVDLNFSVYDEERDGIDVTYPSVALDRAFGRYKLVATDLNLFLAEGNDMPESSIVSYYMYLPKQYNCFTKVLQSATASQYYSFETYTEDSNLVFAEDYVFAVPGSAAASYWVYASIYNDNGSLIKTTKTATVSIESNVTTVVYDTYLTDESGTVPGIDDSFDDEIIVRPSIATSVEVELN